MVCVVAGVYWHFSGIASSILVFWHLQCCFLLSGLVCVALWAAHVVSDCSSVAYACAVSCAHSFTLLSTQEVCRSHVFSVCPLSSPYSFCFSTELQHSMMVAWTGAGFWQAGLVAGLRVGQAYGVFYQPGFGSAVPAPRSLSTQPAFVMQMLRCIN